MTTDGTVTIFAFAPQQFVLLTAYGLDYPGRVIRCNLLSGAIKTYDVEYVKDGDIKQFTAYEDDLRASENH